MLELKDGFVLYHGSYCEVKEPELAGAFGTAGNKEADEFCIRQLLSNKLKDQYCFKTEAAIKCLKFVKGEKIWLK